MRSVFVVKAAPKKAAIGGGQAKAKATPKKNMAVKKKKVADSSDEDEADHSRSEK